MNELFTFNSQQFQILQPPLLVHSRKKAIRVCSQRGAPASLSSPVSSRPAVGCPKRSARKVSFHKIPSPEITRCTEGRYASDETGSKQDDSAESVFWRDQLVLRKLSSAETSIPLHNEQVSLRQRRAKSVKLTPRVVMPVSDRKLPRVFKMAGSKPLPSIQEPEVRPWLEMKQGVSKHGGARGGRAKVVDSCLPAKGFLEDMDSYIKAKGCL